MWRLHLTFVVLTVLVISGIFFSSHFISIQMNIWLHREYYELVNINFDFKIVNQVCSKNSPMMLHVVISAANHNLHRDAIRKMCKNDTTTVKTIFALGLPKNETLQKKIEQENYLHEDIIQGNFDDTYRNLTYKHVMALKYLNYYCPKTNYLLKTDDDVFVNTKVLQQFVPILKTHHPSNLIMCKVLKKEPVHRTRSKWNVKKAEYLPDIYPTFCAGWMIIYSSDVVQYLYKKTHERKSEFFWIDDVFVSDRFKKITKGKKVVYDKPFMFSPPIKKVEEFKALWNFTLKQNVSENLEKFGV
ncbi:beta-1,3-galactosyltransferase 5-like [Aethina tumida]|uniref:beta-1,3-galactosyltransferase 5-like n=1 Tax=Aethina tumida TaxID=116153 RepID=UPI002149986B|nr:beta-1,3-galactosyltransferase 5-like [Aethina tumida]